DAWSAYWHAMAHQFAGRVAGWEIWNEVYWMPVQQCVDLHRLAYQAIKAEDPNALVVANVTIGAGPLLDYMKEFLSLGGAQYCDVVSSHPYYGGFLGSPEDSLMRERTVI